MSEYSQFVSCLDALTSWAKLQSPIGQNLILKVFLFVSLHVFDNVGSDDQMSQKIAIFDLFQFFLKKLLLELS